MGIPTPEIIWRLNWGCVPEKCTMTSVQQVEKSFKNFLLEIYLYKISLIISKKIMKVILNYLLMNV